MSAFSRQVRSGGDGSADCADVAAGDAAVASTPSDLTDKLSPSAFRISADARRSGTSSDAELLATLRKAIANIRRYQSEIFVGAKNTHPGIRYTPLRRVGVCIPGASAPLPSTVMMTAVPAQVAGVQEIVVVSPPRWQGSIHPVILGLCYELGIIGSIGGGAQAVAARRGDTDHRQGR